MRISVLYYMLVIIIAISLIGCGSSNQVKVVPVEGKILFTDGKPLPKGSRLIFNPASGSMGSAIGETDETGAFKVIHQSGKNGAGLGKYTVQVSAPEGQGAAFYKVVPRSYFDNGGILTAEVTEDMTALNFKVKK